MAISFSLVLTAFAVDRLFTDKVEVHSYLMNWSANGITPWGRIDADAKGDLPVVVYRKLKESYCFDALYSAELTAQLTASNKPVITVDYNVFRDFGRERSYNIRSVDGMVFNNGLRTVRPEEGYSGRSGSGDCPR